MAAPTSNQDDVISDINVVPLVDIILVVLIIFMVTAPAMVQNALQVDLPGAGSSQRTAETPLQVAVTADGRVHVNNRPSTESEVKQIAAQAASQDAEVQALIAADQFVDYGEVVRVMDWLKASGVKNLAVTTAGPLEGKR